MQLNATSRDSEHVSQLTSTKPYLKVPALQKHAVLSVIMKCLARSPEGRPADGHTLVEALQDAISGKSKKKRWPF